MHIGRVYVNENIVYHKEVITYYYNVKPISSLFASDTQVTTLLDNMKDKILSINMPGQILIRPRAINGNKIINAYKSNFKRYGFQEFSEIAKNMINDLVEINCTNVKYNYEIYIMFTDGRDELKRKRSWKLFPVLNEEPNSRMMEIFQVCNDEIYKKLCNGLDVRKLNEEQTLEVHNYLALPLEKRVADYFVNETPTHIKYEYKSINSGTYKSLYSKTLIASWFGKDKVLDRKTEMKSDKSINELQLLNFPVDTIVKFDLEHTKEFVKDMGAKKERIKKANKRHWKTVEKNDKDAIKAQKLAEAGENVDESLERSKVHWQLFIRLRAADEDLLERRTNIIRERFKKPKIMLSEEVGSQIALANDLFPYRNCFRKYVQLTDVAYFVQFNYLGGLCIGDEKEGMVITYTQPGFKPIFHDSSKPLLGKTKSKGSTIVITGETGSGKTQLADTIVFTDMVFKGFRTLTVDPKGDREKKIEYLKDSATNLKIGSKECVDGMFDPYLMNNDDEKEALSQAKKDITALARALNKGQQINFMYINVSHEEMKEDLKEGKIKQMTLTHLLEKLAQFDKFLADQVLSLSVDPIARLFFATDETTIDKSFNLNKMYNLITFEKMPLYDSEQNKYLDFNPNEIEHAIFAVVFSRVIGIINGFMKRFGTEENQLILDEFKVFKTVPGGKEVAEHCNRQCRSWQTHLYIISQLLSDIPTGILENTSEMFIGSIRSKGAIDYVLEELDLAEHGTVRSAIADKTKAEGVRQEDEYNFLYRDYNNRKCLTKLIIPKSLIPYFDTHKKEDDIVPVTGTNGDYHEATI